MRIVALIAATMMAAACVSPPPQHVPAPSTTDRDELAVMALVVDSVLADVGAPFLVMADSTSASHLDAEQLGNFVPALDAAARAELMADFAAKNAASVPTPAAIPASSVIRISNISHIFAGEGELLVESLNGGAEVRRYGGGVIRGAAGPLPGGSGATASRP